VAETTGRRRRLALVLSVILIGALLFFEILFDPLSLLWSAQVSQSLPTELTQAQAMWQSSGITNYAIDVEGFVPLACAINATLTVRGGELTGVVSYGLPGLDTGEGVAIDPAQWDALGCPYLELVVPNMFARIERDLERIDWSEDTLRVSFDAEHGYVTEYRYICCYRWGLLNPTCFDCDIWFTFSNFQPVADQ
jgi:hypothetical protein